MSSNLPVTVLMNAYNSAEYLQETLACLKVQTMQDFEVVFWDNASTDNTAALAHAFGSQLRYFHAETTTPLGEARNLALEQVQTDFVAFLDCDDLWEPTKLEKQLALFHNSPSLGLVCTDTVMFSGSHDLNRVFSGSNPARGHVFEALVERQWISMSSAMLRMQALLSLDHWFDPALNLCEEADVFYRIALNWELDYVDEPLTRWRIHSVNTTFRKFDAFGDETAHILNKLRNVCPDFDIRYAELSSMLSGRASFQQAVALWHQGQGTAARSLLANCPPSRKTKLFRLLSYLPGTVFTLAARLYFCLPASFRRG